MLLPLRNSYITCSLLLLLAVPAFLSCNNHSNGQSTGNLTDTLPPQPVDVTLPGTFSEPGKLKFDSSAIHGFFVQFPRLREFEGQVVRFYSNRQFAYAWYDRQGLIEQAYNLYNKIENIGDEGTATTLLYEPELRHLVDSDTAEVSKQKPNLQLELMLTAQYFFYARHIWSGLGEKAMRETKWDLPRKKLSYSAFLDSLLEAPKGQFMQTEPVYHQYAKLKEHLKRYRQIEAAGGYPKIVADKKSYRLGDSSPVIGVIRKRLELSRDLPANNNSHLFDETLEAAVKQFQHRYGMKEDGVVGAGVLAEMNQPIEKRIRQLIVNMERCRWLPVTLNRDYFVVNVPEFRFHAYENDSLAWSMKVVVGKVIHETAIFNGMMKYVVFAPYWNVPPGIMRNEVLPAIRRNPNYLARNHMEWNGKMIRQKPGPWNALGKVKFLFPNSHNIYLHDTPAKNLFDQDQRAFSHGCIRVEQPQRLAEYVLRHQPEWTDARIDSAMKGTKELYVTIKQPIPVLIAYFTAWVDKDGLLNFRKDLYKRDERLAEMIFESTKR
ncbi:MAG TPA: L,D-transpeptidase family protein [Lacibacter sp.]|nr:L,D-transpeptidase family protein [Lacibacter sp.]HMO89471.1 L,D-transpeptidase family protein [Lacibacter sp.]